MKAAALVVLLILLAGPVVAQERIESGGCYPLIAEIAFEGNDTTQPRTMLREMVIEVGDPAEPALIERSRQGVMDLGLFKTVQVREEVVPGGMRVVFLVDERFYLLPLPRLDLKGDGTYAYGAQVRWANIGGLNHSLRAAWLRADRKRQNIGVESTWSLSYSAPFVFDSPYAVSGGGSHTRRPVTDDDTGVEYVETLDGASFGVSRVFNQGGPASQGWVVGGGVVWTDEHTDGAGAPAPYGAATAPFVSFGHRDVHNRTYSEIGQAWSTRFEIASEALGSAYHYSNFTANFFDARPLGNADDQTIHFIAQLGEYFGGPDRVEPYGLGGSSGLRGYDSNFIEGDGYYLLAVEVARPLWKRWLRGVVVVEAGNVFDQAEDFNLRRVHTSLGLGLRVRFTNFVNLEIEAGYAIPLDHLGGGRFFGSRV